MKTTFTILLFFFVLTGHSQSAIYKMSKVFAGNYTESQIKTALDKVMKMYKVPITEENYNRVGSSLYSLRESCNGKCTEMQIVHHMIESDTGKRGMKFTDQAALSAVFVEEANSRRK